MSMELSKDAEEQYGKLELTCLKKLQRAMEEDETNDVVKQAKEALAIIAKNRQTLSAREAVRFSMVASFGDEAQKRKYVEATQPQIRKILTGGKAV